MLDKIYDPNIDLRTGYTTCMPKYMDELINATSVLKYIHGITFYFIRTVSWGDPGPTPPPPPFIRIPSATITFVKTRGFLVSTV